METRNPYTYVGVSRLDVSHGYGTGKSHIGKETQQSTIYKWVAHYG
jgi:hypothetical protein